MRTKSNAWTTSEQKVIRQVYPQLGSEGVGKQLPHRTPEAIKSMAKRIGVQASRSALAMITWEKRLE